MAELVDITREALVILIKIATPILLIALVVGLVISFIQALTQIQETSLTFVPKLFAVLFSLFFTIPFILDKMQTLWNYIIDYIVATGLPL